jgi:flavin-dependent dehydrogenase
MSEEAAPDLREAVAGSIVTEAGPRSLANHSRVAVLGGGPAGSFFAYFIRQLGASVDLDLRVDIFEPRSFACEGPAGCNHCGGVVSESLVQLLAVEGINVPPGVVQRGIASYMLHLDVGDLRIETPVREKRIASVFRGNGPRESGRSDVTGFDRFLLERASSLGATVVRKVVTEVRRRDDRLEVSTPDGVAGSYDLVVVATGINSQLIRTLAGVAPHYEPPGALRTFICEFDFGEQAARQCLGDSMHVFLPDIARLEFAALVPKGRFVTLCLLGQDMDEPVVERFLAMPEVRRCFPKSIVPQPACHCFPRLNTSHAVRPFADRIVWIGDCAVARLYKDGIGSAYRTAKSAAKTAVFHGIAEHDFERHFWPECRALVGDNRIAKGIFALTSMIRRFRFIRRGVLRMTTAEQACARAERPMSEVLWDLFTGSSPYREILLRVMSPSFPATVLWHVIAANGLQRRHRAPARAKDSINRAS